jgi:hypothetical protein
MMTAKKPESRIADSPLVAATKRGYWGDKLKEKK